VPADSAVQLPEEIEDRSELVVGDLALLKGLLEEKDRLGLGLPLARQVLLLPCAPRGAQVQVRQTQVACPVVLRVAPHGQQVLRGPPQRAHLLTLECVLRSVGRALDHVLDFVLHGAEVALKGGEVALRAHVHIVRLRVNACR